MNRAKVVLTIGVVGWLLYNFVYMRPYGGESAPPVDLTRDPVQVEQGAPETVRIERHGKPYLVEKHHRYEIQGHVLMASSYSIFYTSEFFPVDLGLIWGDRVEHVLDNYDFNQGGRWLFWQSRGPVPKAEIEYLKTHISNSHLLPAEGNWNVEKAVRWIDRGDLVRLKGYLVTIKHASGKNYIRSSTTRDDKGDGACEVMWVEEVQIGDTVYR